MDRSIRQGPTASLSPPALGLLLRRFRPGRHDPLQARVGDGLAEMLTKMSRDDDEGTAQVGFAIEHFLRLGGIGVVKGHDGIAEMREGILHSLQDFRFVTGEEACWWGGTQCPGNAIICRRNVVLNQDSPVDLAIVERELLKLLHAKGSSVLELSLGGGVKNDQRRCDKTLFGARGSFSRTGCLSDSDEPGD